MTAGQTGDRKEHLVKQEQVEVLTMSDQNILREGRSALFRLGRSLDWFTKGKGGGTN